MKKRANYQMVPDDDAQFARFWDAYPKRVAKKDARRAWAQLTPSPVVVEQMLTALAWQTQQPAWRKDGGAYVPYPASYLRAERWTDEPPRLQSVRPSLSPDVGDPMTAWLQRKAVGS